MKLRPLPTWLPAVLLLGAGCASAPEFTADPTLLVPWTDEAQREMPSPPYAACYERGGRTLVYVAALHSHTAGNETFALIECEFEALHPEAVVIEGLETTLGASPEAYLESVERTQRGELYPMGEAGVAASLAAAAGVPFYGGEPSDEEIRDAVLAEGYGLRDLVWFYVVRQVPQWKRTGEDRDATFEELYARAMDHFRRALSLEEGAFDDPRAFEAWYEERNGEPFRYEEITTEVCAPIEGLRFTNEVSHAVGRVRDAHIVHTIADLLNRCDRVLVVYGAGHHVQQAKVLAAMLGEPRGMRLPSSSR